MLRGQPSRAEPCRAVPGPPPQSGSSISSHSARGPAGRRAKGAPCVPLVPATSHPVPWRSRRRGNAGSWGDREGNFYTSEPLAGSCDSSLYIYCPPSPPLPACAYMHTHTCESARVACVRVFLYTYTARRARQVRPAFNIWFLENPGSKSRLPARPPRSAVPLREQPYLQLAFTLRPPRLPPRHK